MAVSVYREELKVLTYCIFFITYYKLHFFKFLFRKLLRNQIYQQLQLLRNLYMTTIILTLGKYLVELMN